VLADHPIEDGAGVVGPVKSILAGYRTMSSLFVRTTPLHSHIL
jgi:hypothetical protein